MKTAGLFLLVCYLTFSVLTGKPVQAKDNAGTTRGLLREAVSGGEHRSNVEAKAARAKLLTFRSSDEFPERILNAIKAHFEQKQYTLDSLEKQGTIQMGGKGRIYNYLCTFAGSEKQYHFLFATVYKDASKGELVYKAFFCGDKAEFDELIEKGEKVLKDTLAYDTPRFSFYKGYEKTSE